MNEKNSNLQSDLDKYHTQNQHLTENFTGLQAELLDTQQNFEDQSIAYVEESEENVELKD
jgi:predicted  nucleic acid-binding Zn-ribbon protein